VRCSSFRSAAASLLSRQRAGADPEYLAFVDELQKEPAALPSARAQAARQAAEAAGAAGDGTAAVTPLIAFLLDQHAAKGGRGRGVQARTPARGLHTIPGYRVTVPVRSERACALHSDRRARLPVQRARSTLPRCRRSAA